MNIKNNLYRAQQVDWNNKLRMALLIIYFFTCLGGIVAWPFIVQEGQAALGGFSKNALIMQNSILLMIMIVTELIFRIKTKFQDYCIITLGASYSAVVFSFIPITFNGIEIVILFPIMISVLFFSYQKVIFASLVSLVMYLTLIATVPAYKHQIPTDEIVMVLGSILVCTFLVVGIVERGLHIMSVEEKVLIEEERLISQKLTIGQIVRKDALTGLDNHRTFQENLGLAIEQCDLHGIVIHLAIMDIDDFKQVNDSFGHWAGDIVLRRMGILIGNHCNEHICAARYGGEEFAVIFTQMDSHAVHEWLENLYEQLDQTVFPEIEQRAITLSTGCKRLQSGESREELFQYADQALYKAKVNGKKQIVWCKTH